jgi:hypothetical protein
MGEVTLDKLVAFSILMQGSGGILGKAPIYVLEKWEQVLKMERPESLLDYTNLQIWREYWRRWAH